MRPARKKSVSDTNFRSRIIRCLTPIFIIRCQTPIFSLWCLAPLSLAVALAFFLAGDLAVAQAPGGPTLAEAQREAATARRRSEQLESQARRATGEAARANAAAAALASRIEAAEADITAAQARIALIERLSTQQRARLAASQG